MPNAVRLQLDDGTSYYLAHSPHAQRAHDQLKAAVFTRRELAVLRGQAERCRVFGRRATLPLSEEMVRGLVEVKRVLGGWIEDYECGTVSASGTGSRSHPEATRSTTRPR